MNIRTACLGVLALGVMASTANAIPMVGTTWTDTVYQDLFVEQHERIHYTHSLLDDGFVVGRDAALFYQMTVDLYDDNYDSPLALRERAIVDMPGWGGDVSFWTLSGDEFGGWSLRGMFDLNWTGQLVVYIESLLGDFWVGDSVLHVQGFTPISHEVFEPGSLALFGLGLLGIAAIRRHKRVTA